MGREDDLAAFAEEDGAVEGDVAVGEGESVGEGEGLWNGRTEGMAKEGGDFTISMSPDWISLRYPLRISLLLITTDSRDAAAVAVAPVILF